METMQTLPQIADTKLHGDSKHNPSHIQQHTLPYQHPTTPFRLQHYQALTPRYILSKVHKYCTKILNKSTDL